MKSRLYGPRLHQSFPVMNYSLGIGNTSILHIPMTEALKRRTVVVQFEPADKIDRTCKRHAEADHFPFPIQAFTTGPM